MPALARATFALSLLALGNGTAIAASSSWFEAEGGRVRLVTTGAPDAGGMLRGALQIDLAQGWKTYWRDPGGSGVPPSIDVSATPGLTSATLQFPAPARHQEADYSWVGYDAPVTFAVSFTYAKGAEQGPFDAKLFLGLCQTLCVPVSADLIIDPAMGADDPDDAALVAATFAGLPPVAKPEFGARVISSSGGRLVVEADVPSTARSVDLFIDQGEHYLIAPPTRSDADGKARFTFEASRVGGLPQGHGLAYTLSADGQAVSGTLPYF